MSKMGFKGSFPLVTHADADEMVSIEQVELNEDGGLCTASKAEVISGREYLFFMVIALSPV